MGLDRIEILVIIYNRSGDNDEWNYFHN